MFYISPQKFSDTVLRCSKNAANSFTSFYNTNIQDIFTESIYKLKDQIFFFSKRDRVDWGCSEPEQRKPSVEGQITVSYSAMSQLTAGGESAASHYFATVAGREFPGPQGPLTATWELHNPT